jgi:hypothetical protein
VEPTQLGQIDRASPYLRRLDSVSVFKWNLLSRAKSIYSSSPDRPDLGIWRRRRKEPPKPSILMTYRLDWLSEKTSHKNGILTLCLRVAPWNRNGSKSVAEGTENVTRDSSKTPLNNDITQRRASNSTYGLEPFQISFTCITLNYSIFTLHNPSVQNSLWCELGYSGLYSLVYAPSESWLCSRRFGVSYHLSL